RALRNEVVRHDLALGGRRSPSDRHLESVSGSDHGVASEVVPLDEFVERESVPACDAPEGVSRLDAVDDDPGSGPDDELLSGDDPAAGSEPVPAAQVFDADLVFPRDAP